MSSATVKKQKSPATKSDLKRGWKLIISIILTIIFFACGLIVLGIIGVIMTVIFIIVPTKEEQGAILQKHPEAMPAFTSPRLFCEEVISYVDKLTSFSEKALNEVRELSELVSEHVVVTDRALSTKEKMKLLIAMDLIYVHDEMDSPKYIYDKHNMGLVYCILLLSGNKVDCSLLKNLPENIAANVEQLIRTLRKSLNEQPARSTELMLSEMLQDNPDLQKEYYILMYRYCALVAKFDGQVTEKESAYLDKLMELSKSVKKDESNESSKSQNGEKKEGGKDKTHTTQSSGSAAMSPYEQLSNLTGLYSVKRDVESLASYIKIQKEREKHGMKATNMSYHCVFTGNPGTGKTTVARILAGIYKDLGLLKKGHLVETDRSGLVAEYVGQTAVKTNKIIDSAIDGVLFIDEAYSLISKGENDYGSEAISTLLKRMEDDRERLIVILAGYTEDMQHFIDSNPGLQSRFNRYINFPDYSVEELMQIFEGLLVKFDYQIEQDARSLVNDKFRLAVANKNQNFGNARFVRNFFEKVLENQSARLAKEQTLTAEQLSKIIVDDIALCD